MNNVIENRNKSSGIHAEDSALTRPVAIPFGSTLMLSASKSSRKRSNNSNSSRTVPHRPPGMTRLGGRHRATFGVASGTPKNHMKDVANSCASADYPQHRNENDAGPGCRTGVSCHGGYTRYRRRCRSGSKLPDKLMSVTEGCPVRSLSTRRLGLRALPRGGATFIEKHI